MIFALCRFGGLRCPSEVLGLKWSAINWKTDRFAVHAPKTKRHDDGGHREVPIFPELRPYLVEAFEMAAEGAIYCVTRYRDSNANLRTQLRRIIKKAGVAYWEKTFQNLRSTRQTELKEFFPGHVVCAWLGNSERVADRHYLQVTAEHYEKGAAIPVQNPVQQSAETGGNESPKEEASDEKLLASKRLPAIA